MIRYRYGGTYLLIVKKGYYSLKTKWKLETHFVPFYSKEKKTKLKIKFDTISKKSLKYLSTPTFALQSRAKIGHEISRIDGGQLKMIAQQDDPLEPAALHQVLEQPVEQLHRHHRALVHSQNTGLGKLPGSAGCIAGFVQLVAGQNL